MGHGLWALRDGVGLEATPSRWGTGVGRAGLDGSLVDGEGRLKRQPMGSVRAKTGEEIIEREVLLPGLAPCRRGQRLYKSVLQVGGCVCLCGLTLTTWELDLAEIKAQVLNDDEEPDPDWEPDFETY